MMNRKKQVRYNFREAVFRRDGRRCVVCGSTNLLDAHHIIDRNEIPNGGYVKENGITLCDEHHLKAEKYHMSGGLECITGFHPTDLFAMIKSDRKSAIKKSKELS